jgi:hypothetical protein
VNNAPYSVDEHTVGLGCLGGAFGGVRGDFVVELAHVARVRRVAEFGKRPRNARAFATLGGVSAQCDNARRPGGTSGYLGRMRRRP